jgi:ABC-2 type transport system permease protein
MAMVQDAPFKDYQEMKVEMIVLNKDKGAVGARMLQALQDSDNFIVDAQNPTAVTEEIMEQRIKKGDCQLAIIIPDNATTTLVNTSNQLANELARAMGAPATLPVRPMNDSAAVHILFDPVTKPAFKASLAYALNQFISQVKMEILMERLMPAEARSDQGDNTFSASALNVLTVKEQQIGDSALQKASLNSVQHNVPAWAIFGMFLIVIPMSGNMIRERDEGSALRLQLIPGVAGTVAVGKVLFYILICLVQFVAMMAVGIYLLPVLNLPRLYLGTHPWVLIPMAAAIAFSATSYGFFIGNIFKTANQAMPFGAISVVLLSAIGGVWVPVQILPPMMQQVAQLSPQYWSLEGLNQVMLRGASLEGILQSFAIVSAIGVVLILLGVKFRRR